MLSLENVLEILCIYIGKLKFDEATYVHTNEFTFIATGFYFIILVYDELDKQNEVFKEAWKLSVSMKTNQMHWEFCFGGTYFVVHWKCELILNIRLLYLLRFYFLGYDPFMA